MFAVIIYMAVVLTVIAGVLVRLKSKTMHIAKGDFLFTRFLFFFYGIIAPLVLVGLFIYEGVHDVLGVRLALGGFYWVVGALLLLLLTSVVHQMLQLRR